VQGGHMRAPEHAASSEACRCLATKKKQKKEHVQATICWERTKIYREDADDDLVKRREGAGADDPGALRRKICLDPTEGWSHACKPERRRGCDGRCLDEELDDSGIDDAGKPWTEIASGRAYKRFHSTTSVRDRRAGAAWA